MPLRLRGFTFSPIPHISSKFRLAAKKIYPGRGGKMREDPGKTAADPVTAGRYPGKTRAEAVKTLFCNRLFPLKLGQTRFPALLFPAESTFCPPVLGSATVPITAVSVSPTGVRVILDAIF